MVLNPILYEEFFKLGYVIDLRVLLSRKGLIGYNLQCTLLHFDLEDKIIFREGGNDMIYVVWFQYLMTMILYNEETIGNNKVVEVQKLGKNMHKRITKLWYSYKSDNNRFLVFEYNSNGSLMGTWNGKKSSLDWHYNCVPPFFF
jgi:hypothetical protein